MLKLINVLVVGGGGRESALLSKLRQSLWIGKLYSTGNCGMYHDVIKVDIPQTDFQALADFAKENEIGLTICAMDDLLAAGIVDVFQAAGRKIFGPNKAAAVIESSKSLAKVWMHNYEIPTAEFNIFNDPLGALVYALKMLKKNGAVVIKASGLALGKGVEICRTEKEVKDALDRIMVQRVHGKSGDEVVVEEFLDGTEFSLHVLVDTEGNFEVFLPTQDHKNEKDDGTGRNTGGMGVVGPVDIITKEELATIKETVIKPILAAMKDQERPFTGLLYPGMIKTKDGLFKVLEFNARFGDPETQVYMMLLDSDLIEILMACVDGYLDKIEVKWKEEKYVACIAMASEGYPGAITKKGMPITGLFEAASIPNIEVFLAGAAKKDGVIVNSGGRVLYVVAIADTLEDAVSYAYEAIAIIHFDGGWYRGNIGHQCLTN